MQFANILLFIEVLLSWGQILLTGETRNSILSRKQIILDEMLIKRFWWWLSRRRSQHLLLFGMLPVLNESISASSVGEVGQHIFVRWIIFISFGFGFVVITDWWSNNGGKFKNIWINGIILSSHSRLAFCSLSSLPDQSFCSLKIVCLFVQASSKPFWASFHQVSQGFQVRPSRFESWSCCFCGHCCLLCLWDNFCRKLNSLHFIGSEVIGSSSPAIFDPE